MLLGFQDGLEDPQLGDLFGPEVGGVVEHVTVAVAQDVGRVPTAYAEHARAKARGEDGLHEGLPGLEVSTGDRHPSGLSEFDHAGKVEHEVG